MKPKRLLGLFAAASLLTSGPAMAQSAASLSLANGPEIRAGAAMGDDGALGGSSGIQPLGIVALVGAAVFAYFLFEDDDEEPVSP